MSSHPGSGAAPGAGIIRSNLCVFVSLSTWPPINCSVAIVPKHSMMPFITGFSTLEKPGVILSKMPLLLFRKLTQ